MKTPLKSIAWPLGILLALTLAPASLRADTIVGAGLTLLEIASGPSLGFNPGDYYYSGMTFDADGNLLLAVNAVSSLSPSPQEIYEVPVVRDSSGYITSLGSPVAFASVNTSAGAANNGVGGGLISEPGGSLLYTTNPSNYVGSYTSGSGSSLADLTSLAPATLGGLEYVPASFTNNGAGLLKLSTSNGSSGEWYTLSSPTGPLSGGVSGPAADSFAYVPADGYEITQNSVLVENDASLTLSLYGLDANGNPTGTGVTWLQGDGSVAFNSGVASDPGSAEYLFSTADGSIWALEVNAPEPGTILTFAAALIGLWSLRRRATARLR
jgi:hypothetical protein